MNDRQQQSDLLQKFLSQAEIREVLSRYVRGVDRADSELLKSCYHSDAIEEHAGNYTGNAHQYVDEAVPRVHGFGAMQHLLGSSHIEQDGATAWVETNVWTFVRFRTPEGGDMDTFTGGRLLDRFEQRDGQWKIAHRRVVLDWNRDAASSEGWCLGLFNFDNPGALRGCKNRSDASYDRL